MGKTARRRRLAGPEQDLALRLLPVLAQRRRRGRHQVHPDADLPARWSEIDAMEHWEGSQLNEAKEILAYELTKLVHGEAEAQKAQTAARALFFGGRQRRQQYADDRA